MEKLIKQLASNDNKTRSRSVRFILHEWLRSQPEISDDDMKKLWKALFYCMWHSDKLPAQTYLIDSLSSSLPQLQLPLSLHYLSGFFLTMRREWPGIDRLRLDKFYLLIRRFLHFLFMLLRKNSWDLELCRTVMGILKERVFMGSDDDRLKGNGNGVSYHVASVFIEELRPFLPLRKDVLEVLFGVFVSVLAVVPDKILLTKISVNVFDELFRMGSQLLELKKSGAEVNFKEDDVACAGSIALMLVFSSKFYELGSSSECFQGNRKVLFRLHEEFLKLEKDLASSGIDLLIPEDAYDANEDEEIPTLVPIASASEGVESGSGVVVPNKSNGKKLKKERSKKTKKSSSDTGKKAKKKKNVVSDFNSKNEKEGLPNDVEKTDEEITVNSSSDTYSDSVIANLKMKFEEVAAEIGLENGTSVVAVSKKRKRNKVKGGQQSENPDLTVQEDAEVGETAKSGEKSAKKVRFSMKSNLVWKPHCPLPPQSLRIPPSVTPRGSALKKGIPAGPIREMPLATKKVRKLKRGIRSKSPKPAVKRLKKIKVISI